MTFQNLGLVKTAQGKATVTQIPIPKLREDYIIVKTIAVALNPTDWQNLDEPFKLDQKPTLMGCDAAGIIVEIGESVGKTFRKGDRVAGMAHGGNIHNPEDGTFARYITMKGDITMHIPSNLSFEEAATLPGGIATIGLSLYRDLGLPHLTIPLDKSTEPKRTLLIYGASSASGTLGVQFAKMSGMAVLTTSSPHNFDLLKSLGADHCFDYHDRQCGQKINIHTSNTLTQVFDTIATTSSAKICAEALSSVGGTYVNLMGIDFPRKDVKNLFPLGYTVLGEEFEMEGDHYPSVPEDFEFAKTFMTLAEKLLDNGLIKNHPIDARRGGLGGILEGLEEMKGGKVSGKKLVYRVDSEE